MIVSFTVKNFMSFRDKTELSMIALPEKYKNKEEHNHNYQTLSLKENKTKKYNILKSAVIYGQNASGKSNMLIALNEFTDFIQENYERGSKKIPFTPFKLNSTQDKAPSEFEIVILLQGTLYRYGFVADQNSIHEEWLFEADKGSRERTVFIREIDLSTNEYTYTGKVKKSVTSQVRKNSLLLTVMSLSNDARSSLIMSFFEQVILRPNDARILPNSEIRSTFTKFLKCIDIGINDLEFIKVDMITINKSIQEYTFPNDASEEEIQEIKDKFTEELRKNELINYIYTDELGNKINLPEPTQSIGTLIFSSLLSDILNEYKSSRVIIIDEIEASLHPLLLSFFFKVFHALPNNKTQLICTTHSTQLLDEDIFRRDQIYIMEKDSSNASSLVSLSDFTDVRKGLNYAKQYLDGRFGGIPFLSEIDIQLLVQELLVEDTKLEDSE